MYVAEFIGTFIFVLSILSIVSLKNLNQSQVALGIAVALAVSILIALGLSSDAVAHLNPAVSLAMAAKGSITFEQFRVLIGVQILAALLAVLVKDNAMVQV